MRKSHQNPTVGSIESISKSLEDTIFRPTEAQRKAKVALWLRLEDDPFRDAASLTVADAAALSADSRMHSWFSQPGFREWLINQDEYRQRLEYLVSLGMDAAEEIIRNDDPKAQSARVNMIKSLFDLKLRGEKQASDKKFLDSSIQSMDRLELEAFIQKQGASLSISGSRDSKQQQPNETTLDVTPSTSK